MRNPFNFFVDLIKQPIRITMWVFFLMFINIVSVNFWNEPLAQVIFITFMASAMLMMGLYSRFGFSKILGLGHMFWIPLLAYMAIEMPLMESLFKSYLMVLAVSIVISLIIDVIDVWKYFENQNT